MRPRSFSASSLSTAEGCLSRYQRESMERGEDFENDAAQLGTSVHGGLEAFVKQYMVTGVKGTIEDLLMYYRVSYMETFGTADTEGGRYAEGVEMLQAWHKRTELGEVISAETKESYPLKTSIGEIPFNFIWDRFDRIGENEYAVIDYKTSVWGITPDQLRKKIQARMYGLMAQIKYPDAERIHVKFDMLRHGGPVGVVFSRDENAATRRRLKKVTERIIGTPEDDVPETLNNECNWCIKKATCNALASNVAAGGVMALSAEERLDVRARIEYQAKGLANLKTQLDALIEADAKAQDTLELSSEKNRVYFAVSSKRAVDAGRVAQVVGEDIFLKYGGATITLGEFDKLLKDPNVSEEQRTILKGLIYKNFGEPKIKVEPKSTFGA